MNFSENQIKLAGASGEEDNQREFAVGLDMQGEGIRLLDSDFGDDENADEQLAEDLSACNANSAALQAEIDAAKDDITPPVDPENPDGSGSWHQSVTSQYVGSRLGVENVNGPATMDSTLSLWFDSDTNKYVFKRSADSIPPIPFSSWQSQISWRVQRPDGTYINLGGITQGNTIYSSYSLLIITGGTYTVQAQRLDIYIYDVAGNFDEGYASVGSFFVTGEVVSDAKYVSEITTDQDGNVI